MKVGKKVDKEELEEARRNYWQRQEGRIGEDRKKGLVKAGRKDL